VSVIRGQARSTKTLVPEKSGNTNSLNNFQSKAFSVLDPVLDVGKKLNLELCKFEDNTIFSVSLVVKKLFQF
jgi:hypothetical protein